MESVFAVLEEEKQGVEERENEEERESEEER